jgi:mono/diheme cytochrome c family protein
VSETPKRDSRLDQAAASDESILDAHEKLLGSHPDDGGKYRLLPIAILFTLSGLILFSGTYLNRYTGHYSPLIFDENAKPTSGTAEAPKADPIVVGKGAFTSVCVTCHQPTGLGMPGIYPPLDGSEWVNGSPERVIRIVLYGLKGNIHVAGKEFNAAAMPVFGKVTGSAYNWSDDKIAAVLTYVRQAWGNKSGPITAAQVTAIHDSVGNRAEMSEADLNDVK